MHFVRNGMLFDTITSQKIAVSPLVPQSDHGLVDDYQRYTYYKTSNGKYFVIKEWVTMYRRKVTFANFQTFANQDEAARDMQDNYIPVSQFAQHINLQPA